MRPHSQCLLIALCCAGLWLLSGCSHGESAPLVPVAGKVVVGKVPLLLKDGQFGRVWYHPMKDKGNNSPHVPCGDVGPDGCYKLYTLGKSGAPPGWYRVMIVAGVNSESGKPKPKRKLLIHERYTSFETSGLIMQVVEGSSEAAFDLKLRF